MAEQRDKSSGIPHWVLTGDGSGQWARWWRNPWEIPISGATTFKRQLWEHGYLTPHFTRREWQSGDGKHLPRRRRGAGQRHALALERVRHRLGDRPLHPLSTFRSRAHNAAVGGASRSRHVHGDASDWSDAERARLGAAAFDAAMFAVFSGGGIGVICGTSHVRHVDSRRGQARWCY